MHQLHQSVSREIAGLSQLTVRQLQDRFTALFGDSTIAHNKIWLIRRIAWRLQARAEGGLTERAQIRARFLAQNADLRILPPRVEPTSSTPLEGPARLVDPRLPPPGTILTRTYKGGRIHVQIRSDGFEYEGECYPSLSAVAKRITGSHVNGFRFFQLGTDEGGAA